MSQELLGYPCFTFKVHSDEAKKMMNNIETPVIVLV
jgi:hypothetical protein